jgi:HB1, ASXL, restriction endonuclease HTH domain
LKQHEAVIQALRENGGYATFGQLYRAATQVEGCRWGTKTPFASIRRIVQTHTKDFFKIRPGLWGLVSERERVEAALSLEGGTREAELDHSYYQGLLVEIGNLKQYETFVPPQDKNRPFLSRRLSELASLKQLPAFTHPRLLNRAKTVDVSWFHERGLPYVFFEVEHSTDFRNSLQKFVEFQDFRVKFRVVAHDARRREFEGRIAEHIFTPIRAETEFISYEKLSRWYVVTLESTALEDSMKL